ncbi:hypothetical protein Tco_1576357 [Tanacetum coccineum]
MYKDTLKGANATDSDKEVEFEVELQGSRVEPTMDLHTGKNPGNEDEAKRTTAIPARYRDEGNVSFYRLTGFKEQDDMAAYAFAIAEEKDTHKLSHSKRRLIHLKRMNGFVLWRNR